MCIVLIPPARVLSGFPSSAQQKFMLTHLADGARVLAPLGPGASVVLPVGASGLPIHALLHVQQKLALPSQQQNWREAKGVKQSTHAQPRQPGCNAAPLKPPCPWRPYTARLSKFKPSMHANSSRVGVLLQVDPGMSKRTHCFPRPSLQGCRISELCLSQRLQLCCSVPAA